MAKGTAEPSQEPVGLADLLEALRNEIDESQRRLRASGKGAAFLVKEAEVELAIAATRSSSASAGVQISVLGWLGIGGKGEKGREANTTNTLRLTLTPIGTLEGGVAGRSRRGANG